MDFKSIAKKAAARSFVAEGKTFEKLEIILSKHNNRITITSFDIQTGVDRKTGEVQDFYVFTVAEEPGIYTNGGGNALKRILSAIAQDCPDMSYEAISSELQSQGGLPVEMIKVATRSGNIAYNVNIPD